MFKNYVFEMMGSERKYKAYDDKLVGAIPELLADDRTLILPSELVELALHGKDHDKAIYNQEIYFSVNLVTLPDPKSGRVKFDIDNPLIYTLNEKTSFHYGSLPITQEQYNEREGCFTLSCFEVESLRSHPLSLPELRKQLWQAILGKSTDEYLDFVCDFHQTSFDDVMGIWPSNKEGLRSVVFESIYGNNKSYVTQGYFMHNCKNKETTSYNGLVIGVAKKSEKPKATHTDPSKYKSGEYVLGNILKTGVKVISF